MRSLYSRWLEIYGKPDNLYGDPIYLLINDEGKYYTDLLDLADTRGRELKGAQVSEGTLEPDFDELFIERSFRGTYWLHLAVRPTANRHKTAVVQTWGKLIIPLDSRLEGPVVFHFTFNVKNNGNFPILAFENSITLWKCFAKGKLYLLHL